MDAFARKISRKDMLKLGLLGSAALMLPLERSARTELAVSRRLTSKQIPAPFQVRLPIPPVAQPVRSDDVPGADPSSGIPFTGTDYYEITMKAGQAQILPGFGATAVYGYNGVTPGPTIKARQGRRAVVRQINSLPDVARFGYKPWTSVHLHGSASLPQYDGYASDITNPGDFKDYVYPNFQDARTLWYHDHGVHHTAENAYMGLAAQYHLHDAIEDGLPIPKSYGRYDIPLTIRDAIFDTNGQLVYDDGGQSSLYGDVILVNGAPWPVMKVERRKYRFRLLNASISRSYRLQLSTGQPMTVIATDGGLMPAPQPVQNLRHGMAERYEVIIDFSQNKIGDKVVLQNLSNPNNTNFGTTGQVMRFDVAGDSSDPTDNQVPNQLNPDNKPMLLTAADAVKTREMVFKRTPIAPGSLEEHWTVNGTTWDDVVASNYRFTVANPRLNDVEIWELHNPGGGWFHPVHIHLVDFKVLSRSGGANRVFPYEQGPKDVVYVGEGERVRVLMRFGPQKGRYMMHCHNLVHEDHDMMAQFNVGDAYPDTVDPNDPVYAAQAESLALAQTL